MQYILDTHVIIRYEHVLGLNKLPSHHNDPFDRLLISTAIIENATLITADENIQKYNVKWIW